MNNLMAQKKIYNHVGLVLTGCVLTILASCKENDDQSSHIAADQLFEKSLIILSAYTDSMKTARDSAHVESLARAFESKINAVNFEFPPETDLKLSQEENDSLIKMTDRIVEARMKRLKSFATSTEDSITTDSTKYVVTPKAILPSHNPHN